MGLNKGTGEAAASHCKLRQLGRCTVLLLMPGHLDRAAAAAASLQDVAAIEVS
jgi:hypothetical protein